MLLFKMKEKYPLCVHYWWYEGHNNHIWVQQLRDRFYETAVNNRWQAKRLIQRRTGVHGLGSCDLAASSSSAPVGLQRLPRQTGGPPPARRAQPVHHLAWPPIQLPAAPLGLTCVRYDMHGIRLVLGFLGIRVHDIGLPTALSPSPATTFRQYCRRAGGGQGGCRRVFGFFPRPACRTQKNKYFTMQRIIARRTQRAYMS